MSSEEYDLRQSKNKVGQLYPVLLSKDGKVIDGLHRLNIDSEWRTERLEHIDSRDKFLKARIIANLHRRTVPSQEIRAWINELAEYAFSELSIPPGEIAGWIAEETGYNAAHVRTYLDDKYKRKELAKGAGRRAEVARIRRRESMAIIEKEAEEKIGREKVKELKEAIKEEVKEEVKEEIKKQVIADVKEEAKEELRSDPDFLIETVETALEVLPTLPPKTVTPEGYHKPTLTLQQKQTLVEAAKRVEEKKKERETGPDAPRLREIGKFNRILSGLLSISAVLHRVECPITGNDAETDLIFKESGLTIKKAMGIVDRKLMDLRE